MAFAEFRYLKPYPSKIENTSIFWVNFVLFPVKAAHIRPGVRSNRETRVPGAKRGALSSGVCRILISQTMSEKKPKYQVLGLQISVKPFHIRLGMRSNPVL